MGVARVLDNPHLVGKAILNGEQHENHEGIVDEETWQRIQALRRSSQKTPSDTKAAKYALSDLVKCSMCGGTLTIFHRYKNGKKRLSYRCYNHTYRDICSGNQIEQHIVENFVEQAFFKKINLVKLNKLTGTEINKAAPKQRNTIKRLRVKNLS